MTCIDILLLYNKQLCQGMSKGKGEGVGEGEGERVRVRVRG